MITTILIALFAIVLYCLASASYYLIKKQKDGTKLAKALTWRISLSMLIFIILLISFAMGWLHPHGLMPNNSNATGPSFRV